MKDKYKKQVALLIRIMPSVYRIKEFAVHGGTAINLFHKNMPRYSVDIDLTYIPIENRETSLKTINQKLLEIKKAIEICVMYKKDFNKCAKYYNRLLLQMQYENIIFYLHLSNSTKSRETPSGNEESREGKP